MIFRFRWAALAAIAVVPAISLDSGGMSGAAAAAGKGPLPVNVDAVYRVSFTALGDIGHFQFNSKIDGDAYTLSANAKIDTAIFDYRGDMASKGAVTATGITAQPADYTYNFKQKTFLKKKKVKTLNIAFTGPSVGKVTPYDPPSPKAVPVTAEQLKNVLDPLSGVMALSLGNMSNPCAQKLPIYDGKQRFDVVFTPARRAGADHVCNVRLVPVSGHKPGEGSASVVNGNIELVMRPVPKANIVIPYSVSVPTIVGTATLTSDRVEITMPDQQRIALRR
ncbi:MAG: DUF3108 domain-containing protein [Hyphomicrobium sp.]